MHRLYVEHALQQTPTPAPGGTILVTGDEARHALLVKRLAPGEHAQILDGRGGLIHATLARGEARGPRGPAAEFHIHAVHHLPPASPTLHVLSASPKGDRLADMIDQLSQAGAASWSPLSTARGIVDPRDSKLLRLERVAASAAKQCGRPHIMAIGAPATLDTLPRDGALIVADAAGEPYAAPPTLAAQTPRYLLIGPEGGWTTDELAALRARNARVCRFGPHAMRIETAAVVAVGVLMAASTTEHVPLPS